MSRPGTCPACGGFTEYFVKPVDTQAICSLLVRVAERIAQSRAIIEECHHQADLATAMALRNVKPLCERDVG
jgi:YesN/AraC family two-component response regulator